MTAERAYTVHVSPPRLSGAFAPIASNPLRARIVQHVLSDGSYVYDVLVRDGEGSVQIPCPDEAAAVEVLGVLSRRGMCAVD